MLELLLIVLALVLQFVSLLVLLSFLPLLVLVLVLTPCLFKAAVELPLIECWLWSNKVFHQQIMTNISR